MSRTMRVVGWRWLVPLARGLVPSALGLNPAARWFDPKSRGLVPSARRPTCGATGALVSSSGSGVARARQRAGSHMPSTCLAGATNISLYSNGLDGSLYESLGACFFMRPGIWFSACQRLLAPTLPAALLTSEIARARSLSASILECLSASPCALNMARTGPDSLRQSSTFGTLAIRRSAASSFGSPPCLK